MGSLGDFWRYGVVKTLRKWKAAVLSPVLAARGDGPVRSAYGVLMVPNWQDTTFRYCIFGTYGRDLADLLLEQREAFVFVDIGANQGLYSLIAAQNPKWNEIPSTVGNVYEWDRQSTYIQEPPFFTNFGMQPGTIAEIKGARALGIFGDSVTTDHISPAGAIKKTSPAGKYLLDNGVAFEDFNSYGSRRGNDRIMTRGTFANTQVKNAMADGKEGGFTKVQPEGKVEAIYDACQTYAQRGEGMIVFGGVDYGMGSSRDWAAKGTALLGIRAVVAQSFERIHRSNLVGMGVIPFEFTGGDTRKSLGLKGDEVVSIEGLEGNLKPLSTVPCHITYGDGSKKTIQIKCRIDTAIEIEYIEHGGVLHYVLRNLAAA